MQGAVDLTIYRGAQPGAPEKCGIANLAWLLPPFIPPPLTYSILVRRQRHERPHFRQYDKIIQRDIGNHSHG